MLIPDPVRDPIRWALNLLRRLETYPTGNRRGPLDHPAWRELLREYGLTPQDDDAAVWAAWADLLLSTHGKAAHRDRPLARKPTTAMPATPLKVMVMVQRAETKRELFHPDDAPLVQDRIALLPDPGRHNGRSQVAGVIEETHEGPKRVT